ncbi:MAG: hypothetical protein HYY30_04140, partial [Chloroflexi bacterium]|nr:hypothetical protein [Chloroflexota bacterium]
IADTQQGLLVIDTSAPTTPTEIGNYATSWALGVAVSGNYVYVTDYYDGLHVVSVTDLANPVRVAYYTTRANQIAISGFYIYISTVVGGNGMPILSFAPPQHIYLPVILKSH